MPDFDRIYLDTSILRKSPVSFSRTAPAPLHNAALVRLLGSTNQHSRLRCAQPDGEIEALSGTDTQGDAVKGVVE